MAAGEETEGRSLPPRVASRSGLLLVFADHPVASNLLMAVLLLSAVWCITRLDIQYFPDVKSDFILISADWPGASAQDVEAAITDPIERELRGLGAVREMTSTTSRGQTRIFLEYRPGTDIPAAVEEVKQRVGSLRHLPATADEPVVAPFVPFERVARLLVAGLDAGSYRPVVRQIERELIARGIAQIDIEGLPREELAVEIPGTTLLELDMSVSEIARRLSALSVDLPAGSVGLEDGSRQLRILDQRRDVVDLERVVLSAGPDGRTVTVADVATVERRIRSDDPHTVFEGRPAVTLVLSRDDGADSLESARILHDWLDDQRGQWPPSVQIVPYEEYWEDVSDRIALLVENGATGLLLVVALLFVFLTARLAFWVTVGVAVSVVASFVALYALGGSINMVSLLAVIMAFGIVVDDAIVVGEEALTRYQAGDPPDAAVQGAVQRMLSPVLSSSLTTIAAFLPLALLGGVIGTWLSAIPVMVICVIVASLLECFFILPGHLQRGMRAGRGTGRFRQRFDQGFARFRDRVFRPLATAAVRQPWTILSVAFVALLLALALVQSGRVPFSFLPTPDGRYLLVSVAFAPGTAAGTVQGHVAQMERALLETEEHFGEDLVQLAVSHFGAQSRGEDAFAPTGHQFASLFVQLVDPGRRSTRNAAFIAAWRDRIPPAPALESFSIAQPGAGLPGRDVDILLAGADSATLKGAALELISILDSVPGVSGVEDDTPFGPDQVVVHLTAVGRAIGLTPAAVGEQLRAGLDGATFQVFQRDGDEIEARVLLPAAERNSVASLDHLPIALPGRGVVPLGTVAELAPRRGFDVLRHVDGQLAIVVSADVDPTVSNVNAVLTDLAEGPLPAIATRHGVQWEYRGLQEAQADTLADLQWGLVLALALIYLVLGFVFSSYGWPLLVLAVVPFGLVGAISGHWLLGIDLSLLSLFGLFGLSGIIVNDAIILVTRYREFRDDGMPWREAVVEASCRRLRAVLVTSLTTIGGLTPLMFETDVQAQFLIPMAVSITCGLALGTFVVLLLLPAMLTLYEGALARWRPSRHAAQAA